MFGIKGRQSSDHFRRGIVDGGLKAEVRNIGGHIAAFVNHLRAAVEV